MILQAFFGKNNHLQKSNVCANLDTWQNKCSDFENFR